MRVFRNGQLIGGQRLADRQCDDPGVVRRDFRSICLYPLIKRVGRGQGICVVLQEEGDLY